jgi:aminoglycoside phosphotransferase (APT) family kinase protein
MPPRPLDLLPTETALALLEKIAPGSRLLTVELLPGSFSNHTHLVEARLPDGETLKCVVRRYQIYGDYDRGEKARREFKTFELMNRSGIPSPEPLILDDTGALLGVPGIVTRFVAGELMLTALPDPLEWARKLAVMLARIHIIQLDDESHCFLLAANSEATWFLNHDSPPAYMQAYPGGEELWHATRERFPRLLPVPPALVHIDYWSGNILWHEGEISAVLDWEEAACGDPVIDVAYARMNMFLMGLPEAADEFLLTYETETGRFPENLGFWELAAAVRPMVDPVVWELDWPPHREALQQFMAGAIKRAGYK